MTTFIQASLGFFALCAFLGMAAPFALSANARKPWLALLAALIAVWAAWVLIVAAVVI